MKACRAHSRTGVRRSRCRARRGGAATGYPPRQEDPGFGIYDFKRGFGCSVSHLSAYHDLVFRAVLYRAFRWIETRCAPSLWHLRARLNA